MAKMLSAQITINQRNAKSVTTELPRDNRNGRTSEVPGVALLGWRFRPPGVPGSGGGWLGVWDWAMRISGTDAVTLDRLAGECE